MTKENQRLLNRLHVLSDGAILYLALPIAFWIRFYVLRDGYIAVELSRYLTLGVVLTAVQLFTVPVCSRYAAEPGAGTAVAGQRTGAGGAAQLSVYPALY